MHVYLVWKTPKEPIEDCPYADVGVYPAGEVMGIFETYTGAEERAKMLEERSPSDRFDEQPYSFYVQGPRTVEP